MIKKMPLPYSPRNTPLRWRRLYNGCFHVSRLKDLAMGFTPKKWQKYWFFDQDNDAVLHHLSGLIFHVRYDGEHFSLSLQVPTIPLFQAYAAAQGYPESDFEELIKTRRFEAKRFITRHLERKALYGDNYIFPTVPRINQVL